MNQTKTIPRRINIGNEFTFPLDEFYHLGKRDLPSIEPIDRLEIPEPYKSLLVHERDMTSTLSKFHDDIIQLSTLSMKNASPNCEFSSVSFSHVTRN